MEKGSIVKTESPVGYDPLIHFGIWIWGSVTVILAIGFLLLVIFAGFHIKPSAGGYEIDAAWPLAGLFISVKENGSLVAGILGFSGLAWSHFFKRSSPTAPQDEKS